MLISSSDSAVWVLRNAAPPMYSGLPQRLRQRRVRDGRRMLPQSESRFWLKTLMTGSSSRALRADDLHCRSRLPLIYHHPLRLGALEIVQVELITGESGRMMGKGVQLWIAQLSLWIATLNAERSAGGEVIERVERRLHAREGCLQLNGDFTLGEHSTMEGPQRL